MKGRMISMANESLSKKLSLLSSGSFNETFDDEIIPSPVIEFEKQSREDRERSKQDDGAHKSYQKEDKIDKIIRKNNKFIEKFSDEFIYEFDDYLDNHFEDDENTELESSLTSLGRKYARTNQSTQEVSDISKAFNTTEKALNALYGSIIKDTDDVQKTISALNMSRVKNYKALADMITAKSSYHNAALSTLKEMTNIKKVQFDIQLKNQKKNGDGLGDDSTVTANKALQGLFSMGRDNLLDGVGGYGGVSGAFRESDSPSDNIYSNDGVIESEYIPDPDAPETDGDKFLKYENAGVEYVLLLDSNDNAQVIAEDADGNIIPDYPMPSNIDELHFDVSDSTHTATDDLHRKYKLRRI